MAEGLNFPDDRNEVVSKIQTDIKSELPSTNPYLRNSWLFSLATGLGGRIFDIFRQLETLLKIFFVRTTFGEFLEERGFPYAITRKVATQSDGNIVITGISGTSIVTGTKFKNDAGAIYETKEDVLIAQEILSIVSLTRSGDIATATFADDHNLASGMEIIIAGANETEYNGTFVITVTSNNKATYTVAGSPTTPATGTITGTTTSTPVPVESEDAGSDKNLLSGTQLTALSPVVGLDNTAYTPFDGVGGGADIETDEELRDRLLFRIQNPIALFNADAIINQARKVAFVDRVWVLNVTPDFGQVTIYFTKRGENIVPSPDEIAEVKASIFEIKPVGIADADVIVLAPTLDSINFTFTDITPDNAGMREAISSQLSNFFDAEVELGTDIPEEAYVSTIYQSRDLNTGARLTAFTLSTPTSDITVVVGHLPVLGTVVFP